MSLFTGIIANLNSLEKQIEREVQDADRRWQEMRKILIEIAKKAEDSGCAWAAERAGRAMAETEHYNN